MKFRIYMVVVVAVVVNVSVHFILCRVKEQLLVSVLLLVLLGSFSSSSSDAWLSNANICSLFKLNTMD